MMKSKGAMQKYPETRFLLRSYIVGLHPET